MADATAGISDGVADTLAHGNDVPAGARDWHCRRGCAAARGSKFSPAHDVSEDAKVGWQGVGERGPFR